jgi:hypothetical protein
MTPVYMRQTAKKVVFSESCSKVCAIETLRERWNIKLNVDKAQIINFSHRFRPPKANLMLNGGNIPFVNHVKYLGVVFDKRIIWRLHTEIIEAKAFRAFIRVYSLFKSFSVGGT